MSSGRERLVRLVGERYAGSGFSNFEIGNDQNTPSRKKNLEKVRAYAINILENRAAGRNLILIGEYGTGKDHLATAVMRHAIVKGLNVVFTRGTTLAKLMIAAATGGEKLDDRYVSWDILCISDVESKVKEQVSPSVMSGFLEVIDERYRRRLPTIITSNSKDRKEMSEAIGERAVDRLAHDAVTVRNMWPSHREVRNG